MSQKDTSALDNLNLTFNDKLNGLTDKFEYELRDLRHKNNLEKQQTERVHKRNCRQKLKKQMPKLKLLEARKIIDAETRKLVEKYEHRLNKLKTLMRDDGIIRLHHQEQSEEDFKDEIMDQNLQHKELADLMKTLIESQETRLKEVVKSRLKLKILLEERLDDGRRA